MRNIFPSTSWVMRQATVSMLNVGSSTWTSSGHFQLAYVGSDSFTWGTVPVWLDLADSIGPGQEKTFSFPVTAPQSAGGYPFQWQMTQEGTAFGATTPSLTINVASESL